MPKKTIENYLESNAYRRMSNRKLKLLLLGYLPPPIGGVTVSFKQLVKDLKENSHINLSLINITNITRSKKSVVTRFMNSILVTLKFVVQIRKVDIVSIHSNTYKTINFSILFYIFSKIFKKPLIVRVFAGDYFDDYLKLTTLNQYILKKTIFNADLWLLQTKYLCENFKELCKRIEHFPTSRPLILNKKKKRKKARHFVFISLMHKSKGVIDIFKVSEKLPSDVIISLYGPLEYDISKNEIKELNNLYPAKYKGVLKPEHVSEMLSKNDVLLFPTYFSGEGYPGIIIEAYQAGLPVITTKWRAIPEIVDDSSGIIIAPNNEEQLFEAIMKLYSDEELFDCLQEGALNKAKYFDSKYWCDKFLGFCEEFANY